MRNVSNVKYGKSVTLVIFLNVISKKTKQNKNEFVKKELSEKNKNKIPTTNQRSSKCDLIYDVNIFPDQKQLI